MSSSIPRVEGLANDSTVRHKTLVSPATLEAIFSTGKVEAIFLSAGAAPEADKAAMAAPAFFNMEYGAPAESGFAAELIDSPPPPGLSKAAVFPLGLREKGKEAFVGMAHLLLGYPTETNVFVGLLVLADSFQKKGFGRDFIQGLYDWARPQGISFIRVRVHPQNTAAKAFLDKMGFVDMPNKLSTGHEVWERKLPAVED